MSIITPRRDALIGLDGREINDVVENPAFDPEIATKEWVFAQLGDLADIELFFNDVLVCKHIRQKVAKGLIAAQITQTEDRWQGVVGLVLKLGPRAFVDDENTKFHGVKAEVGDWVLYRNSDGWDKDIARLGPASDPVQCRIIQDAHIRGRVKFPGRFY